MTDPQPYTAERIAAWLPLLDASNTLLMNREDCGRLAATLRDYQRVLAENAGLKRHLEQRASGNDPLTVQLRGRVEELEAEVAALRAEKERLERALHNVRLLVSRASHAGMFRERDADDLLRFCSEAAVVASPLRIDAARSGGKETT